MLAVEPPPKTNGLDPSIAPAASWVGTVSRPALRVCPVTGSSMVTAPVVADAAVRPPAIIRACPAACPGACPGLPLPAAGPGSTTSREMAVGSWYGAGMT